MQVAVQEAGTEVAALQVLFFPTLVPFAQADHVPAPNGHVGGVDLAREDVDQAGVAQQKVNGHFPPRCLYEGG